MASDPSFSSWAGGGGGGAQRYGGGEASSAMELSKELNRQITQASSMQELMHLCLTNFDKLNAVNMCTAYHRIARHVQDTRNPLDRWPPHQQQQLGGLLSRLNYALIPMVDQVQAQNLGITLWSMSKVARVQQSHQAELIDALQHEVANRLHNVTQQVYMTDRHYKFGPQSLSNIIYSAATMNLKLDYDLLHLVGKAIGWQIDEFKPQGLANTLWSLGKLGTKLTFEVRQLVDACCGEMYNQLAHQRYKGTYAPQNISNALHGLAKLGYVPSPELLAELAKCAGGQLRHFGPQEITNMVWGFAQLSRNGAVLPPEVNALVDRIADELSLYFQDRTWRIKVKPQTISNLIWAYAALKRCPQKLNQDLVREMLQILPQFKPQEISNTLWALATMNHYPAPSVIDTMVQASCQVISDFKPQEVSNTVWALATLRHFPGAKPLDCFINHAATMLERFKSQEIGNLLWALARLGYMPAAGFALSAMPYIQSWRQSDVQDCGNLLWAFMILDVLTPEAVQLLGDRLRAMPPQQFTQESYIQIYQAKMAMSQKVATIAQHIPSELLRQAELEWRQQSFHNRISKTHREVSETLSALQEPHELERRIEDGLLSVDLALTDRMVAVEVDGSSHFSANEPFVPLGKSVLRWRMLASRGWRVVTVPYYRWAVLRTADERKEYLWHLLQCETVWDCLSVDPNDRDAPASLPINMSHITPEDVMAHTPPGAVLPIFPESLLPQSASPVSPLGLLPRPGSTHSTPTAGALGLPAAPPPGGFGSAPSGGFASGQLPSLAPRGPPGMLSPQASGFGSPFNSDAQRSASGLAAGPSRLGAGGGRAGAPGGAQANGSVALPDSLYGSGLPERAESAMRPSSSGLSVTAKPFTLSGSTFSSSWEPQQAGGSGSGSGGSPTRRPAQPAPPPPPVARGPPPSLRSSPSVPAGVMLAPPPAGPAGGAYMQSLPSAPASLSRSGYVGSAYGGARSTPGGFSTPSQSPTAASLAYPPMALPPGSAQSLHSLGPPGAGESDDEIDDMRGFFAQVAGVAPAAPVATGPQSVEQVVMRVMALPGDRPVSELAPLLADWEVPRFVELLRALGTPTPMGTPATAGRAVQLFDWVRSLPAEQPLAALCCPATYAAMIDLHGLWRQPGKALRLLSDAKARGVELGSDIYSALVQAMCRCDKVDVAMDAFQHMLTQGLQVNGAVLLAVVGSHVDRGQWSEVTRMLDLTRSHDAEVDAEIFNMVISRAAKADERTVALGAYQAMCDHGAAPTADTFGPLIEMLGRPAGTQQGQQRPLEEVAESLLGLIEQALLEGPEQSEAALLALLAACRAAGAWQLARLVLEGAGRSGAPPGLGPLNEAIAACAVRGEAAEAQAIFDSLSSRGLEPNAASYANLMQAYHTAGQWVQAAVVYDSMVEAGHTPSSEQHSHIISALWESGVAWGQAKAAALFKQADQSRQLLAPTVVSSRGILKVDLNAVDVGTGTLALHNWLAELRDGIGNSQNNGLLDEHRRLVVVNGNSMNTAEGRVASALKGAVGSCLVTHKSPFRLSQEAGRASRLEASTAMVKRWLFTESFLGWSRLYTAEGALTGTGLTLDTLPSSSQWAEHEAQLREDCHKMFAMVRSYEAKHGTPAAALAGDEAFRERRRALAASAAYYTNDVLQLPSAAQVLHAAMVLLDRLAVQGYVSQCDPLAVAAAVAAAATREGIAIDAATLAGTLDYNAVLQATGLEPAPALDAEVARVGAVLGGDTACISALHCWKVFADRLGVATDNAEQVKAALGESYYTLNNLICDDFSLKYPPSVQAAAVLYVARKQAGVLPYWPTVLQELTGHDERVHQQFADAVGEFEKPMTYGKVVHAAVFS